MSHQAKKAEVAELMPSAVPPGTTPVEILGLVARALAHNASSYDPIVRHANNALEAAFERGRKHGHEEGFRAGLVAANQAEAAADRVIEGMCKRV